jgi:phosphoenolpyruvate-protein phosphotransferase (PTS system enzyme I)
MRRPQMPETRCTGRTASPGVAVGSLYVLPTVIAGKRGAGTPSQEDAALTAAIAVAKSELAVLTAQSEGEAVEILSFQVAMLEDDELAAPARAEIAAGVAADLAWRNALDAQVDDYAASDDEYFRARVVDLVDIRDRVLQQLSGAQVQSLPSGAVIAAEDITPSRFLSHDWTNGGAIVLSKGSPSSHVAMLARARQVPMVVGVDFDMAELTPGVPVIVDGAAGLIILDPETESQKAATYRVADEVRLEAEAKHFLKRPAVTHDGTEVEIFINVASPEELSDLDPAICDGIGLVRTELLFHGQRALPDEEQQYAVYKRIMEWAAGRPVIVRTLDAGGDKPIPGLTVEESNPFLGLRGVRLSLKHPDVFRTQLRALSRAAAFGELKVMLPMVTVPRELDESRRHLDAVVAELVRAKITHKRPPLGIMVEVPSVAVTPERFEADFLSIGSNDLTQYVMAAARDLNSVAHLADTADPAVLSLIERIVDHAAVEGVEVSLCGDAASDPALVPHLLRNGLRKLSVSPSAVGRIKAAIAAIDLGM